MAAWKGKVENVAITSDTAQTLVTISIREGASVLWAEIDNNGPSALDEFNVQVSVNSDSFHTIATVASDYTTIVYPLLGAITPIITLASDSKASLAMEVRALNEVRFSASALYASDTTVSVYWRVR